MDKRSSTLKLALLSLFTLCLFCMTPVNAQAAINDQLSPEYLAGFAFFKFAKVQPDFKDWVFRSKSYAAASPRDRTVMLRAEAAKLENSFAIYEIDRNPITLKARVKFMLPTSNFAQRMLKEQGKVIIPLQIPDFPEKFFPLQVAGMWIALIPADIDQFLTLQLSQEEWENFKRQADEYKLIGRAEGVLSLSLIPVAADTKKPLTVQGLDMWMLMAEVEEFELWTADSKSMVWFRDIPGAKRNQQSLEIDNLYDR